MSISKLCENVKKCFNSLQVKFEIEVLTTTANGLTELQVAHGTSTLVDSVPVTYFKRITKDHSHFSPQLLQSLWNKLKDPNIAHHPVVHIHAWWNLVSVLSCVIALITESPVILSPRGTLSNYSFYNRKSILKRLFHELFGKYLLQRCYFHVTSDKEKNDILRLIEPKGITVIPNFVKLPPYKKEITDHPLIGRMIANGSQEKIKILFLSRIEKKKGLELLFQALSIITIPWTLSIAGNGKSEYVQGLKDLANHLQLNDKLHWLGHLNDQEKFTILESNDLLVLPSHDENFANVVIESIAMGTPVLVSSKVGLADYVKKNNLGITCEPEPESIKQGIEYFFTHQGDFNTHIFNKIIKRDFNEEKLVQQYLDLYQSLN